MSIIRLEIRLSEVKQTLEVFRKNRKKALEAFTEGIRTAVSSSLNELMSAEIDLFLGATNQRDNKRNGYAPEREYVIKGIGGVRIRTPKDRNGSFSSHVVPSHERVDPRIKEDMAVLHLAGLSTRTLSMISRRLLGVEVGKDTISSSLEMLSEDARTWLMRPITEKYWALYVDGTNFKIQRRGSTKREPSLVVLGVDENTFRSILAIEPGTKDNVECWRAVFKSIKERGLHAPSVRLGIMDGLPGLESLFKEEFPNSVTQRCWVHSLRNAMAKTPARLREDFLKLAHKVMYATSEDAARRSFEDLQCQMAGENERAILCLAKDLESLLTHYKFDHKLWTALRTTNAIEAINRQFKRRTKSMETIGEKSLETVLAFVALKIEMGWRLHRLDSGLYNRIDHQERRNAVESAVENMTNLH